MNETAANQSELPFLCVVQPQGTIIKFTNGISIIGTILNIIYIFSLFCVKRDYTAWNFIRCRCICNLLVCFFGVFYTKLPEMDCLTDYKTLLTMLFIDWSIRIYLFSSLISDNLLILNRLAHILNQTKSRLYTLSIKVRI